MNNKNKFILTCAATICTLLIVSCSSNIKKADIPQTANPQDEISKLNTDLAYAISKNVDVLAPDEFKNSIKWYEEAKADLRSLQKQEEILDDVRTGRGYLQKATVLAEKRENKATGLLEARQAALLAGANQHAELKSDLSELDSDVSAKADNLSNISTEKLAELQKDYIDLERRATILTQLGKARAMLNGAKKDGATKKAPISFKKAELSLSNAEAVISTNVRSPEGFQTAVASANVDANYLMEVMTTIKQNGKTLSESSAMKMVAQNKQIKNLNTDLNQQRTDSQANETASQLENKKLNAEINTQSKDLNSAKASVEIQRMLENARSQFSKEEAEAYQQGETLLIRLKKVNFASGRSELPQESLAVLAKVSEVAKSLNASEIKVEGHTDSTGTQGQNKTISESRAQAVATYFRSNGFNTIQIQSEGYGFEKPIATNKSKEGRAQNRRVDIIITPKVETVIQ